MLKGQRVKKQRVIQVWLKAKEAGEYVHFSRKWRKGDMEEEAEGLGSGSSCWTWCHGWSKWCGILREEITKFLSLKLLLIYIHWTQYCLYKGIFIQTHIVHWTCPSHGLHPLPPTRHYSPASCLISAFMSYMMLGFCIKSRNYKWESWCLSEMGWIPLLWCSPAALFPHKQRNLILLCDSMHFYCIGTTFCPPLRFWALVGCITITVISVVVNIDVEVS